MFFYSKRGFHYTKFNDNPSQTNESSCHCILIAIYGNTVAQVKEVVSGEGSGVYLLTSLLQ